MTETYIISAVRTPVGAFLGSLKDLSAPKLGAAAIREAVRRAAISPDVVDECLMGCVLTAGVGQAPARQSAIWGGLPQSVKCTTINRVCGSAIKSVMLGSQMIQTGDAEIVVAGGMESMSRAPYLSDRVREGFRLGHAQFIDSIIHDGLWDVYKQIHMGSCAEYCVREKKISREEQDRYARQSYERALAAIKSGKAKEECVTLNVGTVESPQYFDTDEEPGRGKLEKFSQLKPAFEKNGTVTVANASSLSDGAAALVLAGSRAVSKLNLKPIARIISQASHAGPPEWFTTAPIEAVRKVLEKAQRKVESVDLFEINEAFSAVALACISELGIDEGIVNVRGGAVAMGHPIGASGARILVTLLHALASERKKTGVATLCIGGGEASAVLVERM